MNNLHVSASCQYTHIVLLILPYSSLHYQFNNFQLLLYVDICDKLCIGIFLFIWSQSCFHQRIFIEIYEPLWKICVIVYFSGWWYIIIIMIWHEVINFHLSRYMLQSCIKIEFLAMKLLLLYFINGNAHFSFLFLVN